MKYGKDYLSKGSHVLPFARAKHLTEHFGGHLSIMTSHNSNMIGKKAFSKETCFSSVQD